MTDMEKVLNGLECCSKYTGNECNNCPYDSVCKPKKGGRNPLMLDAIDLLKAQTPRILTREAMEDIEPGNVVWLEQRDEVRTYLTPMIKYDDGMFENRFLGASPEAVGLANTRFWSAKPTDEQRKAVAWIEA